MTDRDADQMREFLLRLQAEWPLGADSADSGLAAADEPTLIRRFQSGNLADAKQVLAELYRRFAVAIWNHASHKGRRRSPPWPVP